MIGIVTGGEDPYQGLYISTHDTEGGTVVDHTYYAEWDYTDESDYHQVGAITIELDPEDLDIVGFSFDNAWYAPGGAFTDMHVDGGAIPLSGGGPESELTYALTGSAVCGAVSSITWQRRLGDDPISVLNGFSCPGDASLNLVIDDYEQGPAR